MKIFISIIALLSLSFSPIQKTETLTGAWEHTEGDQKTTRIYTSEFFSVATYNMKDKNFEGTYGGKYKIDGKNLIETIEFDTWQPTNVGTETRTKWELKNNRILLTHEKGETLYTATDNGNPGKLAGAWLITGRFTDGQLRKNTPGARRTMKILSGTRFQWIAYNVETKEFFGTGGGTYTSVDGKYTENIEFFSRDASRVGVSLGFDFSMMDDGSWRHSGKSSKGEPIDEIWTQREKIGI
jgi:hypothetical protein